jgi:hypothetical protein
MNAVRMAENRPACVMGVSDLRMESKRFWGYVQKPRRCRPLHCTPSYWHHRASRSDRGPPSKHSRVLGMSMNYKLKKDSKSKQGNHSTSCSVVLTFDFVFALASSSLACVASGNGVGILCKSYRDITLSAYKMREWISDTTSTHIWSPFLVLSSSSFAAQPKPSHVEQSSS